MESTLRSELKVGDEVVFVNNPPGWGVSLNNSVGIIVSTDMKAASKRHFIVRVNSVVNGIEYPFHKNNLRKLSKLEKAMR